MPVKERIYVASSWRNDHQQSTVRILRDLGHDVYDFRNPIEGDNGFSWKEILPGFKQGDKVTAIAYGRMMQHPSAVRGYEHDIKALQSCTVCIAVLPFGRSASWEFGYAQGQGKRCYLLQFAEFEPELMFREAKILTSYSALYDHFEARPC